MVVSPEVRDLFLWHALEEAEHKAVAFDVYRAVGGTERMRRITMNITTVGFLTEVVIQTTLSLLGDRNTYRWHRLRPSLGRLRRSPILRRSVWRRLREFNRPGFHPDDHDTTELVTRWREELFGTEGSLNARLRGAA